jgi:hypothetical protein
MGMGSPGEGGVGASLMQGASSMLQSDMAQQQNDQQGKKSCLDQLVSMSLFRVQMLDYLMANYPQAANMLSIFATENLGNWMEIGSLSSFSILGEMYRLSMSGDLESFRSLLGSAVEEGGDLLGAGMDYAHIQPDSSSLGSFSPEPYVDHNWSRSRAQQEQELMSV